MSERLAIGIDLGGNFIKGGVVFESGAILTLKQIPTGNRDFDSVCNAIAHFVNELENELPGDPEDLVGIGIGSPGGIRNDRATISISPNFPTWQEVNLIQGLNRCGIDRLILENDANLAALGENWLGCGRDVTEMAILTLGTGIGGGIIIGGRIWRGAWGMAGELGHITVNAEGPLCGCGNTGCLEAYINIDAILARARGLLHQGLAPMLAEKTKGGCELSPKLVYEAATEGDGECMRLYAEVGRYLGIVIADLLHVLNLPLFAIGGGVSAAFELMEPYIHDEIRRRAYREPAQSVRIERATLGNNAGVLGAARLVFQEMG